ncbi:phospholipase A2 inhibitor NAI-like [Rhinoderma darwinii]|uniref:phospholipase A2 inhibitor NAI-like n=1 Tax=Rhinoderma darwinii TaxID=43563 RepID=UPI003F669F51
MYLWGFLYLLSAFAASGDCLQCLTCSGISLESCSTTNIVSCLDGHVCVLQKRTTNANGSIAGYFERFCAPPTECNVTGTFTHYLTKDRIATTCCYIDLCTPEIPIVPTGNSEPNGLSCPKCSLTGDFCTTDPNMNCTGNETMCLLVSTLTKRGAQTELQMTRGCASSGYCSKNNVTSAISDGNRTTVFHGLLSSKLQAELQWKTQVMDGQKWQCF